MRLPRIRFTMGMMLFSVAVVAANFWGFRRLYETNLYQGGTISFRILPAGIGLIPLCNVAAIGSWVFAARWVRSRRPGREASPRSSWPGVAYFCLQILMIVGLVSRYDPEAFLDIEGLNEIVMEFVAARWGSVFGSPEGTVAWVVFASSVLGVLVSGPPLVLAWIGQRFAKRCAETLPRPRFRALTGLVSLGFAIAGLSICVAPRPFDEEQEFVLDFRVLDGATGRPIPSSFIRISIPFYEDPVMPPAGRLTDANGRARLSEQFPTRGERNAFGSLGVFSPWGRWIEISAADFQTLRVPLPEVVGPVVDLDDHRPRTVKLTRGQTPDDPFRSLAGEYGTTRSGFGGMWFAIKPDGRFAWTASGCTSSSQEYGYLRRVGGEIELVTVPDPDRERHPCTTFRYRTIEWGDCLYLSSTRAGDIVGFCRGGLIPERSRRAGNSYGGYVRESDVEKKPTGLPRLSARDWLMFVVDEMRLDNKQGKLRLALDSLDSPKSRARLSTNVESRD